MAITVPKYSDAGGSNTNLPTRRLTGFSGAGIRQMGAPGAALAGVGRNVAMVGKDMANREIEKNKEEMKLWVVNAETQLKTELAEGTIDLKTNTRPEDYLHNESFKDGTNPDTYYNKSKSLFDSTLEASGDDGKPTDRYKAPSPYAEKMWEAAKLRIRNSHSLNAMNYEAQVRSQAVLDQLEQNLEQQQLNAYDDPASVVEQLDTIDSLVSPDDDPLTNKDESRTGILPEHLVGVHREQEAKIVYSAFEGYISEDAFGALAALKGKTIKGNNTGNQLKELRKKLTPGQYLQLENAARRKASVILDKDINEFEGLYTAHVTSLAAGGNGIEEFNLLDLKGGKDKSGLERAHNDLYFGKYEELKRELMPDHADKHDASWQKISSGVRIARIQGDIINSTGSIPAGELNSTIERFRDMAKQDPGNMGKFLEKFTNNKDVGVAFTSLPFNEQVQVISGVIENFAAEVRARNTDFGAWANNTHDAIQYMPTKTPEQRFEKLKAVLALADKLEQPMGANYILPDSAAKSISSQASAINSVNGAVQFYDQLVATYGEGDANHPVFQRVWQQLTTMNSGALGPEWQWYSALKNTQSGGLFFNAGKADRTELDSMAKAKGQGFTTSKLDSAISNNFQPFIAAATGNIPQRAEMGDWMMQTIEKMVLQEAIQNNHGSFGTAVETVKNALADKVGIVSNERANFLILPQHTTDSGRSINQEIVEENIEDFFDQSRFDLSNTLTTKSTNGLFIPGTLQLPENVGIEEKHNLFIEYIMEHGRFVMGPDGKSVMIVIPQGGISSDSADGYGSLRPIFSMDKDGGRGEPMLWSLGHLGKPQVDMGSKDGDVKVAKTYESTVLPEIKLIDPSSMGGYIHPRQQSIDAPKLIDITP
tara:strand:+ start:5368 stop:8004 length:2637 start_codon:yes stop_codon:yes gene_type:complete